MHTTLHGIQRLFATECATDVDNKILIASRGLSVAKRRHVARRRPLIYSRDFMTYAMPQTSPRYPAPSCIAVHHFSPAAASEAIII